MKIGKKAVSMVALVALAGSVFVQPVFADSKSSSKGDYVILKVNGDKIRSSEVQEIWESLFPNGQAPDFESFDEKMRQNVLRGIVSEHLINKEAVKAGVGESEKIKKQLERIKSKLVTQEYLAQKADAAVSDAALRAAYKKEIAKLEGKEEVRARHILVETKDEAESLIKLIKEDGKKFEDLARDMSKDKASAVKGGDLGYFRQDDMVKEFSDAAFKLKKGEISEPVKTGFGWHVIKVEDRRPVKKPSFEEMKGSLEQKLRADAVKKYVYDLIDSADIQYFDKNGKKKEFSRTPDTTK